MHGCYRAPPSPVRLEAHGRRLRLVLNPSFRVVASLLTHSERFNGLNGNGQLACQRAVRARTIGQRAGRENQ